MKTRILLPVITAIMVSTMACTPKTTKSDIPTPTPQSTYNTEYGDGIGAPRNVVHFPDGSTEWILIHGD